MLVLCWDDETTYHRSLGAVYGYDDQLIPLEPYGHMISDNFSLLAEMTERDGRTTYRLIAPGGTDPDDLCYEILPSPGQIRIRTPGLGAGCRLFLASCAVTEGKRGNIREQNHFEPESGEGLPAKLSLFNPAAGQGGETYETMEEVRLPFP